MATESIASTTSLVSSTAKSSGDTEISITRITEVDTGGSERQIMAAQSLAQARASAAEQTRVSREAFEKVVSELESFVQNAQRDLDFHVDDKTGRVIVKVIDAVNDQIIRQIPSDEMLVLSRRIQEFLDENSPQFKGVLLELKA